MGNEASTPSWGSVLTAVVPAAHLVDIVGGPGTLNKAIDTVGEALSSRLEIKNDSQMDIWVHIGPSELGMLLGGIFVSAVVAASTGGASYRCYGRTVRGIMGAWQTAQLHGC